MADTRYILTRYMHNLEKGIYVGEDVEGEDGIPVILPEPWSEDLERLDWVDFSAALKIPKGKRKGMGIHFYSLDYHFERVWNDVDRYTDFLGDFDAVHSPDFSIYANFPRAVNVYNHYRKHYLARYWQDAGIRVIPSVAWSRPQTWDYCFLGEPHGGVVSVSSTGVMRMESGRKLVVDGYHEMVRRLEPSMVLWRGIVPEELEGEARIRRCIKNFADKFGELKNGNKGLEEVLPSPWRPRENGGGQSQPRNLRITSPKS